MIFYSNAQNVTQKEMSLIFVLLCFRKKQKLPVGLKFSDVPNVTQKEIILVFYLIIS